nr:putative reverse transcriptase domain-containing protein [Tanacetum cinerariifolium]
MTLADSYCLTSAAVQSSQQWHLLSSGSGNFLHWHFFIISSIAVQTPGSGISNLLAVGTTFTGSGNLYCQWELSPGSGNALCILFPTGDRVMLKVSPWKGVVRFGKRGKLNPRYVGSFKVLAKMGTVAYRLELPQELSRVHHTFHVSNLKKCYTDEPLVMPLEGIHINNRLQFVEEPIEIMEREIKILKQSQIPLVKVRWNSRRGTEFTWKRKDSFRKKYPHLFTNRVTSSTARP